MNENQHGGTSWQATPRGGGQAGGGAEQLRGRSFLGAMSRRAVSYFVDPGEPEGAGPDTERRGDNTVEFELPPEASRLEAPHAPPFALPQTRSGHYEREAVDARLAELERELAAARSDAAVPTGVEAEIQQLGAETSEILRVAHHKAEELVVRATAEAAALRTAAKAEAEATTRAAELRLRELDAETDLIWAERARLTDDTLRLAEALRLIAASAVERFPAAVDEGAAPAAAPEVKSPAAPPAPPPDPGAFGA